MVIYAMIQKYKIVKKSFLFNSAKKTNDKIQEKHFYMFYTIVEKENQSMIILAANIVRKCILIDVFDENHVTSYITKFTSENEHD